MVEKNSFRRICISSWPAFPWAGRFCVYLYEVMLKFASRLELHEGMFNEQDL